jgi:hypothetical protein
MDIIDKVAEAINEAILNNSTHHDGELAWREMARAAIKALRDPTPEMLKACDKIMGGGWMNSHSDLETWHAMIDEALK